MHGEMEVVTTIGINEEGWIGWDSWDLGKCVAQEWYPIEY